MDTSTSRENFRVAELMTSKFDEERALAIKAREVIGTLVDQLKPILKYVATLPQFLDESETNCRRSHLPLRDKRALYLLEGPEGPDRTTLLYLFLSEEGKFLTASKCTLSPPHDHYHYFELEGGNRLTWERFPFQQLLTSLQQAVQKAIEKREGHLASIRERREMLDEILEVIKRPSPRDK